METTIQNRYDFFYLFDVQDGNPNGDPDAGNLPRIDPETGAGLVSDVCLKRKVRNFVQIVKGYKKPYDIYIKEKSVLGRAHVEAFCNLNIKVGEAKKVPIPDDIVDEILEFVSLCSDDLFVYSEENNSILVFAAEASLNNIKEQIKELSRQAKKFMQGSMKDVKSRKPTGEEVERGRAWMCQNYYDIRTFGAVLSLKSAPNCGQVRGPIQFTFARSVEPIVTAEHSITRMAVATEAEAEKQSGDNRTMGRKFTVPYGLYKANGFISAHLAAQTGFNDEDLNLFWEALKNMFDHDHSAARGMMSARKLIVFKHNSILGNASAHALFDLIQVKSKNEGKPARSFSDYEVTIDRENLPAGVEMMEIV